MERTIGKAAYTSDQTAGQFCVRPNTVRKRERVVPISRWIRTPKYSSIGLTKCLVRYKRLNIFQVPQATRILLTRLKIIRVGKDSGRLEQSLVGRLIGNLDSGKFSRNFRVCLYISPGVRLIQPKIFSSAIENRKRSRSWRVAQSFSAETR